MTATTIRVQMAQRKDTAANWTAANPILLSGEIGYETDTKKFKIGDGTTNWNSLAYLPIPDGSGNLTITGNLEIGTTGSLTFEGSTANGFETTLAVTDPTADRTITLPNVSGTVVTTGDTGSVTSTMIADGTIVNADISGSAEIAVSKLANGTANQVIVTDGTNVSWSDNLTLAGDLTVNGTTTTINTENLLVEDKNIIIGNVATPTDLTADGGGITLKGATDKTINWLDSTDAWTLSENVDIASGKEYRIAGTKVLDATSLGSSILITTTNITNGTIVDGDINASAAIAGTKISPNFGSQNVTTTGTATAAALIPSGSSVPTNGVYLPSANNVAISTNSSQRLLIDASGNVNIDSNTLYVDAVNDRVGLGTSSPGARLEATATVEAGIFTSTSTNLHTLGPVVKIRNIGDSNVGTTSHRLLDLDYEGNTTAPLTGNYIRMMAGGSQRFELGIVSDNFTLAQNGTARVTVNTSGNVGIGTTAPGALLDLAASNDGATGTTANNTLRFTDTDTNTAADQPIGKIEWYSADTSSPGARAVSYIMSAAAGANSGGDIRFGISANAGTATEAARLDSSGRLLVGASSQSGGSLLQVNDNRIRIATAKTPASATDTGVAGEICWDANYVYVCTATNTWKRTAISTW
jgi:hypothetical protein